MTWCPAVLHEGLTLTVCERDDGHAGRHRLGSREWTDPGVRLTVDGDVVGAPPRRSSPPLSVPRTATAVLGTLDAARADVGLDHPVESHVAAAKALRSSRSLRADVLALVAVRGEDGATSDEVEQRTGRAHQSISATLYGLEKDGLAVRSGPVRPTRYANDARAYVATSYGRSELSRLNVPRPSW